VLEDTDILITQGPAPGYVDGLDAPASGCVELLKEVRRVGQCCMFVGMNTERGT
jgi:hypothetical protein